MAPGQVALIIFAVAFLLLVLFIGFFLLKLTRSLDIITLDVDSIARSSNEILGNANTLLNDVNGKVKTLDPTVQAVAEMSTTVSQLNATIQNVTNKFSTAKAATSFGASSVATAVAKQAAKSVMGRYKNKKSTKKENK
ncbi:DUF948 domain-containing protein [uncultured Leuconostoc sp.]|uniref:DUF948 domain-containing protein n=1 Tax=uncultured Leuconostoc sp. TaxID=173262 RepID=UPI0025F6CF79|nr:DUF948 domain-containing protein [uncultured Leuconostoc sp.]